MQNEKIRNALVGLVAILMIFLQTIVSAAEYSQWDCPECGRTGNTRKYCGECGHPAPELENDNKVTSISNDTSANEQPVIKDYLLAASQGDAEAQHNLGYCYEQGIGVEQDYIKAYRWYKTANSNGYSSDGKELKTIKESYLAQKYKNQYYANGKLKTEYLFDATTGNVSRLNNYNRYGEISRYEIYDQWDPDGNILRKISYNTRSTGKYKETTYFYTYDNVGNCLTWTTTYKDGSVGENVIKTYDINGNCLTSKTFTSDGSIRSSYVYTYDEDDHITSLISQSPDGKVISKKCDYQYEGDHCTGYTVLNANDQIERYYQAVWQNDILVKRTEVDTSGNEIENSTYDLTYGDVISAKYPDDNGNFYETYYTYGTDSFEEDWRSLSSGYRSVTTYNTKEERLQVDSYTRDSSSQGWVYESTSRYSINEENQTEVESRYADGSKYIKILDDNEMPIFSQSYNADGSFKYASSYEYNEKGQETRRNILDENVKIEYYYISEYDVNGRKSTELSYNGDGTYRYGYSYVYNEKGQEIQENRLAEDGSIESYSISEYDVNDKKTKELTYYSDGTYRYGYSYVYNEKGQRIRENKLTENGSVESYSVSDYDENGEKSKEIDYGSNEMKTREIHYRRKDGMRQWKWIYYNSDGTLKEEKDWENY